MTLGDKQMFILGFMTGVLSNQQEKAKSKEEFNIHEAKHNQQSVSS